MLTDRSRTAIAFCSTLAIATALLAAPNEARAQSASGSFQGTGTPLVPGSATITVGTGTTDIDIIGSDAVIDWTTFDTATGGGPINFQPSGTTATFRSGSDFSVLNRIIPTDQSRAIQFNGNIVSLIQGESSGGSVFFYSPGGVIVGSTAVFDVGNLGLTSIAPEVVGGVFEQGAGSEFVRFNGAVTPGSSVQIQAGAQINSSNTFNTDGSYVAIVAPVISQRGTINVDGAAALVSADAATITFNPTGLFDIQVTSGTSGNLGGLNSTLFNDGTITGPAFSGTGPNHRIYMVAVPKNTAITMAINGGSSLGFDVAFAADVVGNAVVLSSGYDIVGGNIAATRSAGGGTGAADLNISGSTITSALTGASTRDASLFSNTSPTSHAFSNVSLRGENSADISATAAGNTVAIDGAVTLTADSVGASGTAGVASIFATDGGNVNLAGDVTLSANATGPSATAGSARASVEIAAGQTTSLTIGGNFTANANATATGPSGSATGGPAQLFVRTPTGVTSGTGTLDVGGNVNLSANATGTTATGGGAGALTGVLVSVDIAGASVANLSIGGSLNASAAATATTGLASGGSAQIFGQTLTNDTITGSGTITIDGAVSLTANAAGGSAVVDGVLIDANTGTTINIAGNIQGSANAQATGSAGAATGGDALFFTRTVSGTTGSQGGRINAGGNVDLSANATGATADAGTASLYLESNSLDGAISVIGGLNLSADASGGTPNGGLAELSTDSGSTGTIIVGGAVNISAKANVGDGFAGTANIAARSTGSSLTIGGLATLNADSTGILALGGTAQIFAQNQASVTLNNGASLFARGIGNAGAAPGSVGEDGIGGVAIIQALTGGDVSISGVVNLNAGGFGGAGNAAAGGDATGGQAQIFARDTGSSITINGTTNVGGNSVGGVGNGAAGGSGTGGISIINAQVASGASIAINGNTSINSNGTGGNANAGGAGGLGTGGTATAAASDGNTVQFGGNLDVFGVGLGGNATGGGLAGSSQGGAAKLTLFNGGAMTIGGNAQVFAPALGAQGNGAAATATGGLAEVTAQQNSTLDVTGFLNALSGGIGTGDPATGSLGQGGGLGGTTLVSAFTGGSIDVGTVLRARSASTATGNRNATGGTADVQAFSGGSITASELNIQVNGLGGNDTGTGAGNGTGGVGRLTVNGAGSTVTIANGNSTGVFNMGDLDFITAQGFGGQTITTGGTGGTGTGGTAAIIVQAGGTLTGPATTGSQGFIRLVPRGTGGNANADNATGGQAIGGRVDIVVNGGTMTSADLLPSSFANAGTFAPSAATSGFNITGGNATGGVRNITVNNGGTMTASFTGGGPGAQGGNGLGTGRGGDGTGGSAGLVVDNGSTLSLTGSSSVFSQNAGGAGGSAGMGGNGTAGSAFVRIANGSTLTMDGPATNTFGVHATAFGGFSPTASLTGSNSIGGSSTFVIENATANLQTLNVTANGTGGGGLVATGGNGTGGNAFLQLIGATLTADSVVVNAVGRGGSLDIGQSGVAGNGMGGLARLIATGGTSTVTVAQSIGIGADGLGGDIGGAAGTTTGNGIGGTARLVANNGASLTLTTPNVEVVADGEGGEVVDGSADIGGDGTGGFVEVFANSGNLTISGNLSLESDNDGGEGIAGGDGLVANPGTANVILRAQNGTVTVGGLTSLKAAGDADSGASSQGGFVVVDAQNNLAGPSTITLNSLNLLAPAGGGAGTTGAPGQPGGAGGNAQGGIAQVFGNAGNGRLVVNSATTINVRGAGGAGGAGGTGATPAAGGAGGNGNGGSVQFGTRSGIDTGATNIGSARFAAVSVMADGIGGAGGAGGVGETSTGAGGVGGDANGGVTTLLVRGSPLTIAGATTISTNATGGAGGTGSTQGAGGDATVGLDFSVSILATSRFEQPTQRGFLDAQAITGTAIALGGAGSTVGVSTVVNQPLTLEFSGASGTVASIDLLAQGSTAAGTIPSLISLTDGTLDIDTHLDVSTPGSLQVTLDRFTVNVADLTLDAGNFVLNPVRPTTLGTFNVSGTLNAFSLADFLAFANFNVAGNGFIDVPGSVLIGDLNADGEFDIDALGSITTGAIVAGEFVGLVAGGDLTTGAIIAGEEIDLEVGGAITTGQLTAGGDVEVSAGGAVTVAGASAGIVNPSTDPEAEYTVVLRSLTSIVAGDLTALGNVGLGSPGSITVGKVTSGAEGRGFLALAGTGLTTGAIDTSASANGGLVYLANFSMESLGGELASSFDPDPILASTPVAISGPILLGGAVSTGRFQAATTGAFIAQAITAPNLFQLAAGADVTLGDISSFIVNVSSAASLTIGAVTSTATAAQLATLSQTNGVVLTAANTLTTGAIQAGGGVSLDAGGAVAVGSVTAGTSIGIDAGLGITGAAMVAGGLIEAEAGGAIMLGNLSGGRSVNVETSSGTLSVGNVVAGPDPITQFSIGLLAEGNLTAGNLTGNGSIGLLSNTGSITAGAVSATRSLLALARGAASFGGITTGATASDFTYIANASMVTLGGALDDNFNPAPIFAAAPVATTGPVTIGGTVSTGNLIAATTGALSIGSGTTPANISVPGDVRLTAAALEVGNITAGLDIALNSSGALSGGNLTAGDAILANGAGAVALGALSAGLVNPSTATGATRGIGVRSSGGGVTVGSVSAARDVILAAGGGNLAAGNILTDSNAVLLARDSASTGSLTVGSAGQAYIAGSAMAGQAGSNDSINPAIFNLTPAPLSGAISIGGPVRGGTFAAAANGNFTADAMTLGQNIRISRAALLQVNGAWVAPTITLASQRIAFGTASGAAIGGTGTTSLTLRALASGQTAVLGGTTAGSGYSLTQADFGRIRAGNLTVQVDPQGVSGGAPDLEIRDLTLNGSAGSGSAATTITTPGRMRVTGDLVLQQAGAMDTLNVNATDRLEIVLPEGSIAITGAGGALAGTLTLSSNNLVAGTLDILQQVMADPEAAGLADALKTPASTTSNLAGYIRAEGVKLLSNANILLQNSGTARDFAGVTTGGGGLIIGRISPASSGTTGGGSTGGGTTSTSGFSFTGMLASPNEILMFQFQVDANSEVTLRTYSYAGGTNAAGQVIPAGGFDPILALFDAAGALIGQNDDGGSNVPADPVTGSRYDTFFQPSSPLAPGTYTVSVSVFSNFAVGPNLSNGFEMNETDFGTGRTANFAFDVLGAATATGPGSMTPTSSGPLNVIGFGRQQTATGTITGEAFFTGVNFGTSGANPLVYTDLSQFNTCLVNGGSCGPVIPMSTPLAPPASEIVVVTTAFLPTAPPPPPVDDAGPGDSSGSASDSEAAEEGDSGESQDEDESDSESDEAASPISPPTPLISTRALDGNVSVVEPVSGAGNPALFGSAVNETTVQGEQP